MMPTRNKIEEKSLVPLNLIDMKSIDPNLIGDFKGIDYPARRQFPSDEIVERWKQRGHTYVNYTGLLREEYRGVPQWAHDIVRVFKRKHLAIDDKWYFLDATSLSLYHMPPGTIMPEHEDTYPRFREIYGEDDVTKICRILIFLDDWKTGHYFEMNREPYVKWKKGNYLYWTGDTSHLAANLGMEDRYTMQITATLKTWQKEEQ